MKKIFENGISKRTIIGLAGVAVLLFAGFKGVSVWQARVTPEKIAAGKALFTHQWSVNDELCGDGDGLGPVFNSTSCVECHSQGGLGGSSGNEFNVTAFEVQPHRERTEVFTSVIHSNATTDSFKETRENVEMLFPMVESEITVTSSSYDGGGCGASPTPVTRIVTVVENPVHYHQLNSPALFGVGLIDEISSMSIVNHGTRKTLQKLTAEFSGEFGGTGIGMTRLAEGGAIGKFGWKGQFSTLEDFVASACAMELGLTNPLKSQPLPLAHRTDRSAKMDMTRKQLNELVCFVRSLPRPVQVVPSDPDRLRRVNYGETIFAKIGCADCHVPNIGNVEGIYSDFHLYNLEPVSSFAAGSYADGKAETIDLNRSHPDPDQWQTPPLWGVADSAPYFHDGASPTILSAINRHKGQANHSREAFDDLSTSETECLIEFLQSLRAPEPLQVTEPYSR